MVVDKPAGMGSTDAVTLARKAIGARKAGHAGTLDRPATGILAIAFGEATKTITHLVDAEKSYRFAVRFGIATSTCDAAGDVVFRSDRRPDDSDIENALTLFRGNIMQVPPAFSAVRISGQRAWKLAMRGEAVEIEPRPLLVSRLVMTGWENADTATFEMICGKGGYVRAIARDLGEALGCYGHAAWLRRTATGPFSEANSISADRLRDPPEDLLEHLLPLEAGLAGLPEVRCNITEAERIRSGNPVSLSGSRSLTDDVAWASHEGSAVAVGLLDQGVFSPRRVFARC